LGVSRGFTLLELLIVLFLMGLAYGLAAPMVGSGAVTLELKSATRQLAAGLRKARGTAIAQRDEATMTVDVELRRFSLSGDSKIYPLPKAIDIELFTAQSEQLEEKVGNIRFFPDGTSTGGRITLTAGGSNFAVDVDWLTGKVVITP
jgi:general secretion pathway protein H